MRENTNKRFALTQAQRRIWSMEMMYPNTSVGIIVGTLFIRGPVNTDALMQAIYKLVRDHDAFRIRIASTDAGEPVQWFVNESDIEPRCDYLEMGSEAEAKEWLERFNHTPLSIFDEQLYQFCLFNLNNEEHWFNIKIHHSIADGIASHLLCTTIMENYTKLIDGQEPDAKAKGTYLDYIYAEQEYERSDRYQKDKAYWLDKLESFSEITRMKPSSPYSVSTEADRVSVPFAGKRYEQLQRFSEEHNISTFTVFLAALYILLHKVTGNEDITVGTIYANRTSKQEKETLGMFVSTVATRMLLEPDQHVLAFLQHVSKEQKANLRHQKYPYNQLIQDLRERNKQWDVPELFRVDIEYLPVNWTYYDGLSVIRKSSHSGHEVGDFAIHVVDMLDDKEIDLNIDYRVQLFDEGEILRISEQLFTIIDQIVLNPLQTVRELSMLSDGEKNKILTEFNPSVSELPPAQTFHQLFEEQAALNPSTTAVVYENNELTYGELNERANRLAGSLRGAGIGPESVVGILADRSVDLLVGVMAVWKAGGAYVPLDPDYPSDRIRYMLEDSGAAVLLTQSGLRDRAGTWQGEGGALRTILCLDDEKSYSEERENAPTESRPDDLAYVIYTSGTTGRPKGVMIEHRSLVNTAAAYRKEYRLDQFPVRLLQLASFSFDVFVGDIARTLYNGGTMVICPKDDRIDPTRLHGWIQSRQITVFESTPALIIPFMEHVAQQKLDMSSMKLLITSSDSCSVEDYRLLQERFGSQFRIINSYGVTEAAIDSSFYDEPLYKLPEAGNVPIGKAWLNAKFYIVDAQLNPVPVGILGELCIGGPGVARGYMNRPELTEEKFADSPFAAGERLYRTGDLARWMEDGNVDFIGRIDYQVKIRGYRIELGEIETAMLRFDGIRQAVVTDRTDERGQKYLCGYVVSESEIDTRELHAYLEQTLPSHMVPARVMLLDRLPLTPNGKVDRKALPEPEGSVQAEVKYIAPRTPAEQALAAVWQSVLGVDRVGLSDNFFGLGGDSIKALQVSSRLLQAGYKLVMRDLFHYPTIASLSPQLQTAGKTASQEEVTGAVTLTPIQRWFFGQNPADPHHSNQAFMQYRREGFEETALRKTIAKLVEHHDALRTVYRKTEAGYEAWNRGTEEELFSLEVADFTGLGNCKAAVEAKASEIQGSIDLENGPLVKLGLFRCPDGDHLLMAIHHLVVDGVSWRILFEDFAAGYEQALGGQAISLPHKTDSFQTWAGQLSRYADSGALESERAYWRQIGQLEQTPLPKDLGQAKSTLKDSDVVTVRWTEGETEQLLKQAHRAYNTEMNDLLLTALGMAVQAWTGRSRVLVNLEGHGREDILPEVDITRTVGWFTSQFPVLLESGRDQTVSQQIKQTKEGLRRIPNKGIGYGILRYLSEGREGDLFGSDPEISFNYLGQFDQDYESSGLEPSPFSTGNDISENAVMDFALDMNGMVTEGSLELTIRYGTTQYRRETIERLGSLLETSLRAVIAHCLSKDLPELTPSDVLLPELSVEELEQLTARTSPIGELENVYTLTPMQKGMLFHSMLDADSEAYFEQVTFDLQGSLDAEAFAKGLDVLIQRHEALRTNFISGWKDEPVQIVFRQRKGEVYYEDVSGLDEAERVQALVELAEADKARKFDLAHDSLMRVTLVRTDEQTWHVIWSHHHILMDGWCMSFMIKEVFESYFAFLEKRKPELPPVTPFARYIEWLEKQDRNEAADYWRSYLNGYDQHTKLPQEKAQRKGGSFNAVELEFEFSRELSERIERVSRQNQVTLSTFVQTLWGLVLQVYNNSRDVVFGCVVSGRPADIAGVESMIGLFINTIPVRVRSEAGESVADVLRKTQEQALGSGAYDTFPLYEIQALSEQKRDLISHIMVFENYPMEERIEQLIGGNGALAISNIQAPEQTNYDFDITVIPGERTMIRFTYNADTFSEEDIRGIHGHFTRAVEQAAADPNIPVEQLELLTLSEKEQLFEAFNPAMSELPQVQTFHRLFEEQAVSTPDARAVVYVDKQLTYRELNEKANRLAATLREGGVGRESIVGILAERSVELLVGVIAVWKAGGAYVPLDPDYPADRIRFMLEDSGATVLLTQTSLRESAEAWLEAEETALRTILCLDDEKSYSGDGENAAVGVILEGSANGDSADNAASGSLPASGTSGSGSAETQPHDLAYVIYTSGTTGRPKGVMIEHRSLVNTAAAYRREYRLDRFPVRLLQLASFSFDVFVGDIARTLYNGGTMVIVPKDDRIDPARLHGWIHEQQITVFESTPALIVPFMEHVAQNALDMSSMELLITSSDSCSVGDYRVLQERFGSQFRIINSYGVTEAAIDSSFYDEPLAKLPETGSVPIGKAWLNARFYIVDAHLNPVPVGVLGELCIGGPGVARGYLNRPDLTEEKFVDSPFVTGERLYRTGDLAQWTAEGNVDFIGRIDHQAKIRGYRIETGEVESQLLQADGVREAVVLVREDGAGQKALCAYFTADGELAVSSLRSALAQELPGYMIPSYFIRLERIPLTPNGKVDRKALPAPEAGVDGGAEYIAPRTPLEAKLAAIWQDVLGLQKEIGIRDNFFDLGGHSLRATTLVGKVHKELNVDLPLRDVFRHSTVEDMAEAIANMERQEHVSIPAVEKREFYPLSSAQKRLYILNQLEGAELSYNMPGTLILEGALDRNRFEEAFRGLIRRHETLRTGFEMANGEAVQRVYPDVDFSVEHVVVSEEEAAETVRNFVRPFDLAKPPLLRVGLVELAADRHILMFDMHHIVSDGVSMDVLVEEFVRLYSGEALEPLRIQYKDYAVWQQSEGQKEQLTRQEAYWLNVFRGELPVLELPTDYARPALQSYEGRTLQFFMDAQKSEGLKRLAAETGTTLYMVLFAAYTVMLHKYTAQEDLIVGTPIAGRTHGDVQPLIGMFVNTLAIRNYPAADKTFLSYLQEVKETTLGAYEHQNYPFEELVDKVQVARDLSRNPIFDTMFTLQNTENKELQLPGLRLAPYASEEIVSKFDLSLDVTETSGGLDYLFEYATSLYKKETIERMAKHYEQLLNAIVKSPEVKIADLELVTPSEKEQLLEAFNPAMSELPQVQTFHRLFEAQAVRTPDAAAVVYEDKQLTYRELNEKANRLAATLRAGGVGRESIVGILAERSVDLLVGVIAVWKAGGAYVPLDPDYPADRIRFMLEDSGATVLLTQTSLRESAEAWLEAEETALRTILCLDDEKSYGGDGENAAVGVVLEGSANGDTADSAASGSLSASGTPNGVPAETQPHDLAYVIYTSGTTGRPKGVMIEHRSLVNTAAAYRREYRLDRFPVRLLQLASFSFDVFVGDIARTLYNGGTIVIVPKDDRIDPARLHGWIQEQQITVFESTPALIVPFMEHVAQHELDMSSMELLITSSDSCSVGDYRVLQERFGSQFRIINSYGVTEAAIDSSFYDEPLAKLPETGSVPIGKAWLNARFYIVDAHLNAVPVGVLGELCIGGPGVARGYLNRPDLTEEKFVDSPFVPGERLYRTGDLARWTAEGNVDFIGRIDHQAKIRGYRIETGEVESQLLQADGVREAVVLVREDGGGQKALCAYFTADGELAVSSLRSALAQELPGYMIPSYFIRLERIPLTPNGKVDRKALPAPEAGVDGGAEYIAPRTALEAKLAAIWQDVLGLQKEIGIRDNFFDLGGHSLRATTLVGKVHKELNVDLPLRDVFRHSTIEEMAQTIAGLEHREHTAIPVLEKRAHYPLSSVQKRLYIQHQMEGAELSYNMSGLMVLKGELDRGRFEAALRGLIGRHEILRTAFEMVNGEPAQVIYPDVNFALEYRQSDEEGAREIAAQFVRVFDLEQPPLLRVGLIALERNRHILMFDIHHLVSDGVSTGILIDDLLRLYTGESLQPLRIQYKDFASWQQSEAQSERLKKQEAYWLDVLDGELPRLELATDFARPAVRSYEGDVLDFAIDKQQSEALRQIADENGATLYMVFLAAYTILLHKYSGQEDIIVGTPVSGRTHADTEPLIGMFVNTLAIRNCPSGDKMFLSYLEEIKETMLGAYENQDYPFEELVEKVQAARDLNRHPIFDTVFVMETREDRISRFGELTVEPYIEAQTVAKFDLTLEVTHEEEGMSGHFEYATKLFTRNMIDNFAEDFLTILSKICEQPHVLLKDLSLNGSSEQEEDLLEAIDIVF
ncbi:amino acid adenylation domain-containing protein [Paenibacillus chitinolyticus]|uniref:amino acid adenylation domain-containing protein n=1 Tax=Paenibacillus chitinolyticus TaxID=79263 RepID=UPI00364FE272